MATATGSIVGFEGPWLRVKRGKEKDFINCCDVINNKCGKILSKIPNVENKNDVKSLLNRDSIIYGNLCNVVYSGGNEQVFSRSIQESEKILDKTIREIVFLPNIKSILLDCLTLEGNGLPAAILMLFYRYIDNEYLIKTVNSMVAKYDSTLENQYKKFIENNSDLLSFVTDIDFFKEKFEDFIKNTNEILITYTNKNIINKDKSVIKEADEDNKDTKEGGVDKDDNADENKDEENKDKENKDEGNEDKEDEKKDDKEDKPEEKIDNKKEDKEVKNTVATNSKLSDFVETTQDFKFNIDNLYILFDVKNNESLLITDNVNLAVLLKKFNELKDKDKTIIIKTVKYIHNFRPLKEQNEN